MYFDSWSGFLAMEGHGLYVWGAYAVAMLVIAYNLVAPMLAKRRVVAQVRRQERLKNTIQNSPERVKSPDRVEGLESVERGAQ